MRPTKERPVGAVYSYPVSHVEVAREAIGGAGNLVFPRHDSWLCGACGSMTNGRIVCDLIRQSDGAIVKWCLCSCERAEPTITVEKDAMILSQHPQAREFHSEVAWPDDLRQLFDEAAIAYAAGAYTAAAMVARKILMACAYRHGADEGRNFSDYVEYITNDVLVFPGARESINKIRTIGNDANHRLEFVQKDAAYTSLKIVSYILRTIYSLPQG